MAPAVVALGVASGCGSPVESARRRIRGSHLMGEGVRVNHAREGGMVYVPLRWARRDADRDEREQVLRGVEDKSGNHEVKLERPAMRGEPA